MLKSFARSSWLVALLVAAAADARAQPRNLDIYWVDVEGGAATLIVSPSGESVLIDSGWEVGDRDAKRIFSTAQRAGLARIDYFILSHFHADHAGGLVALAKLMPIGRCFDRGDFIEPVNQKWRDGYLSVCGDRRTILKPGDRIPLKSVQVEIVASDGHLIAQSVNGGGQTNPLCAAAENKPKDVPENQLMVGALVSYGRFTFLDLADLDWEKEMELACPVNKLGQVTIWQAGRHGALDGAGAPGFLYAIKPQVVVVNNGPRKGLGGASPGAEKAQTVHYERIAKTPGIEGIWQAHLSLLDKEHNTAEPMIANLEETADCQGHFIRASVAQNGTFTVTNSRNGFTKTYVARGSSSPAGAQNRSAPAAQPPAPDTTFYAVSYVESVASAAPKAIAALKQYREANRKRDGFIRFEIFEQVGRPGHFALVETWRDQAAFDARGPSQTQLVDALAPIRVSDYDLRPYKTLSIGPAPPAPTSRAVSVVSHVDVTPDPRVAGMLRRLAEASRMEEGNERFDVMQHTMRANHFTVVETWRDQKAFDAHVAATHTRQYRDELQPLTGSPLDERVYKAIE
jgi:quinol monooxygenase YgiN/beta-lactamase superfamily II metal-dependent hydrolase